MSCVELRGGEGLGGGLGDVPMLLTSARCMRMTSRKGSRLT